MLINSEKGCADYYNCIAPQSGMFGFAQYNDCIGWQSQCIASTQSGHIWDTLAQGNYSGWTAPVQQEITGLQNGTIKPQGKITDQPPTDPIDQGLVWLGILAVLYFIFARKKSA